MRKTNLTGKGSLLFFFLFGVLFSYGQNFRLGFQASPHLTWMNSSSKTVTSDKSRVGIKYGVEADIFLAGQPRYSFNTGLFVSHHSFSTLYNSDKPFVIEGKVFNKDAGVMYKLNYIEIPINLKLRSDQFYRFTYYGQFGITNYMCVSTAAYSDDYQLDGSKVPNAFGFYNFGLIMGGGAEYDVGGNTALNFGIQYTNTLIDYSTIEQLAVSKFHSIRLILGVLF